MKLGAIVALAAAAAFTAGCASQAAKPCCQGKAAAQPVVQQNACKGVAKCKTVKRVHHKRVHKTTVASVDKQK